MSTNEYLLNIPGTDLSINFYVSDQNLTYDAISNAIMAGASDILLEARALHDFIGKVGTFVDIGANLGIFSFVFAKYGNTVYGFEANKLNYDQCVCTSKINGFSNVFFINSVVANKTGQYYFVPEGPYGHLKNTILDNEDAFEVCGTSIDDWYSEMDFDNVSVVKLDIEGSEILALEGMLDFLRKNSYPPIYTEFNGWCLSWNDISSDTFFKNFRKARYSPYRILDQETIERKKFYLMPDCVDNILMIHDESPVLKNKTIVEQQVTFLELCDTFFERALVNTNECELYYYLKTLVSSPILLNDSRSSRLMSYIKSKHAPFILKLLHELNL